MSSEYLVEKGRGKVRERKGETTQVKLAAFTIVPVCLQSGIEACSEVCPNFPSGAESVPDLLLNKMAQPAEIMVGVATQLTGFCRQVVDVRNGALLLSRIFVLLSLS